ncbi:MAG TPA: type II toxin-antitoxin system Phd/YefM family antitoxin [Burkholderiales bacterium]|nr:type II toxin-antitoxin system Phd/YefM family antitoxin [Burkholderiales bacterium]
MEQVNIHEAKANLSRLVDQAAAGTEIVIAKAGKPLAKLVPYESSKQKRTLGLYKGKIKIARDFDAPLPDDLLDLFEGRK